MARTGKRIIKEPVKVRTKKLADGSESYYLDIYHGGKRSYEFLKLYRLPELSDCIKMRNKLTLAKVEEIKAQRTYDIICGKCKPCAHPGKSRITLLDWMDGYKEERERKGLKDDAIVPATKRLLGLYVGMRVVRLGDVDKEFCLGFLDWLRNDYSSVRGKPLSPQSIVNYAARLSSALNSAVRAGVIDANPFSSLSPAERPKARESGKAYLTIDEVKALRRTPCSNDLVKRAYLFSCFCGLRLSDVYALRWGNIFLDGAQWRVSVIMRKTSTPIFLPLSMEAMACLPGRADARDGDRVFDGLVTEQCICYLLPRWAASAGITKHVTFHTSRHTFATMMLTLGVDIYTVSKLLGHTNVKTTQIYAKIIDQKKIEAVNLLDKVFARNVG